MERYIVKLNELYVSDVISINDMGGRIKIIDEIQLSKEDVKIFSLENAQFIAKEIDGIFYKLED